MSRHLLTTYFTILYYSKVLYFTIVNCNALQDSYERAHALVWLTKLYFLCGVAHEARSSTLLCGSRSSSSSAPFATNFLLLRFLGMYRLQNLMESKLGHGLFTPVGR